MALEYGMGDPLDTKIGNSIRERRTEIHMSQKTLGELVGMTFQQIQKYEKGTNRVSALTLFKISKALGVSISYFDPTTKRN